MLINGKYIVKKIVSISVMSKYVSYIAHMSFVTSFVAANDL